MKKNGKYLALLLTCTVFLVALSGCAAPEKNKAESAGTAKETASSGTEAAAAANKADTAENAAPEDVADAVTDTSDREQTISVKAYPDGTPREVKIKNSGDDLETNGDPALLPFAVHIRYFLDGKEMTPQEIAGRSGHVRIVFEYTDIAVVTESVEGQEVDT